MRVGVGGDGSARVKTRQSGEGKSARRNHEREHTGGRSGATPIRRRRREANDRDRRTRGLNVRQGRRMAPCREDYIARTAREAPKGDRSPTRAYRPVGDTRRSPTGLRALVRGCLHGEARDAPWVGALRCARASPCRWRGRGRRGRRCIPSPSPSPSASSPASSSCRATRPPASDRWACNPPSPFRGHSYYSRTVSHVQGWLDRTCAECVARVESWSLREFLSD